MEPHEYEPITDESIGRRFPDEIDVGEALADITLALASLVWAVLVRFPHWLYRKARR
jgi:hypothetical protein